MRTWGSRPCWPSPLVVALGLGEGALAVQVFDDPDALSDRSSQPWWPVEEVKQLPRAVTAAQTRKPAIYSEDIGPFVVDSYMK
ncbi:hypothetical protein CFAM422_011375 [Trichoderma lentiforme]|uniref:Uncharacterized protein n=1 Tax=Trichoderma lentiforme TaxID=1567552 RepID=A0A9P4X605_9HYPO|nr:hypothetical protein CFAM422_011375 [Trichoderma lentiforme]